MSKTLEFTVISSNPNQEGGFVTKIRHSFEKKTEFGMKKSVLTLYVSGSEQLTEGNKVQINPQDWTIKEYPYALPDTGEIVNLKWLHLKNEGF